MSKGKGVKNEMNKESERKINNKGIERAINNISGEIERIAAVKGRRKK